MPCHKSVPGPPRPEQWRHLFRQSLQPPPTRPPPHPQHGISPAENRSISINQLHLPLHLLSGDLRIARAFLLQWLETHTPAHDRIPALHPESAKPAIPVVKHDRLFRRVTDSAYLGVRHASSSLK